MVDKIQELMVFYIYTNRRDCMRLKHRKLASLLLAAVLCLPLVGCGKKPAGEPPITVTQSGKPILPGVTGQGQNAVELTAVYVSVFENLAILSGYPVLELEGEEPECAPREISKGGSILCGGEHEREAPITRVLITGPLVPQSMSGWFRNMVHLESIEGLEKIRTDYVTDMSHLFAGCERLNEVNIDRWNISGVTDMTGIFDGCTALADLPEWYGSDNTVELE
jgi:surface protein